MTRKRESKKGRWVKQSAEGLTEVVEEITLAGANAVSVKIRTPEGNFKVFRVARKPTFKKVAA